MTDTIATNNPIAAVDAAMDQAQTDADVSLTDDHYHTAHQSSIMIADTTLDTSDEAADPHCAASDDTTSYDSWPVVFNRVMQSPATFGRAAIYTNRRRQQQLVCSTPLMTRTSNAAVASSSSSITSPSPSGPLLSATARYQQAAALKNANPCHQQLSASQALERDMRYMDQVILPACKKESFHMSRVQTENLNSAQKRNYKTLCRHVYGPTAEDLAEAEAKYQERYGHLHKPVTTRKYGMRL